MRLVVRHRTAYAYSSTVAQSRHLVHLAPRPHPRQRVEAYTLTVYPEPAESHAIEDDFGNPATIVVMTSEHKTIEFVARTTLEVLPPSLPSLEAGPGWESVAQDGARGRLPTDVMQFIPATPLTVPGNAVEAFAADYLTPGRPVLAAAMAMTRGIYAGFRYDPKATDITTALESVLEMRRGVCQDFAHLMIAAWRSAGLPARYVSGYLVTYPPAGGAKLTGADASHAWVSVWAPGAGWVDFDPTNDMIPRDEHVSIAFGRDFQDVSPITGILLGGGEHEVEVGVDVDPAP